MDLYHILSALVQGHTNSKVSSMFAGTQEKCVACKKTVYPIEKVFIVKFETTLIIRIILH